MDQTGPGGQGSLTGRRMGRCTNFGAALKKQVTPNNEPLNADLPENLSGRGFGLGRGGRGRGGIGWGRQNRFGGGL